MNQSFQAIYDHGVLRPLEPIDVADQAVVSLTILDATQTVDSPDAEDVIDRQQANLMKFVEKVDNAGRANVADDLSHLDHDQIIYGI